MAKSVMILFWSLLIIYMHLCIKQKTSILQFTDRPLYFRHLHVKEFQEKVKIHLRNIFMHEKYKCQIVGVLDS